MTVNSDIKTMDDISLLLINSLYDFLIVVDII